MTRLLGLIAIAACVGCGETGVVQAKKDAATVDYETIVAIKVPPLPDAADLSSYTSELHEAWKKREPLLLAFLEKYPSDDRAADLFNEYWQSLMKPDLKDDEADAIISSILQSASRTMNPKFKKHADFWTAFYVSYRNRNDIEKSIKVALDYSDKYPSDPRGAVLFNFVTLSEFASEDQVKRAYASLSSRYGESQEGQFGGYMLQLMGNLHKPFDFAFDDVRTGKHVTDESFRGKIVVVDFWATWCAPCIAALPRMKETFKKYQDKGVAFVGISLDESEANGGKQKLLDFLAKNEVPWPQYYLGGDKRFVTSLGIDQIPTVFVLDREGKIASVDGYRVLDRTLAKMTGEG